MAEREVKQILPGGINLHLPVDAGEENLTLVLENWRADAWGKLRSRFGHGPAVYTAGSRIHSISYASQVGYHLGAGTVVQRGNSVIGTGLDGRPISPVAFGGFVWIMNQASGKQLKDNGTTVSVWLPAAPTHGPTATAGGPGNLTGDLTYYVTFSTDDDHETNPYPVGAFVGVSSQQVELTNIPIGGAGVTKRHIYRIGGSLENAYRVATIHDNVTTTHTDNLPDTDAIVAGIILEPDHDPPPQAAGLAGPYNSRLIAYDIVGYPNRLAWTKVNRPWYFPASNYTPVGDSGERILAVTLKSNQLWIYKERSIWRMVGDFEDFQGEIESTYSVVGLAAPKGVASYGAVDFIVTTAGIYRFNGDTAVEVSQDIRPIFLGETVSFGSGAVLPGIDLANISKCCLAIYRNQLWFSYPRVGQSVNTNTAVYDIASGRWFQDRRGFDALYWDGAKLWGGISNGMHALEEGTTDNGQPIPCVFHSRYWHLGAPDNPKHFVELVVEHNTGGQNVTVKLFYNNGAIEEPLATINSTQWTRSIIPLGGGNGTNAFNAALVLDGNFLTQVEIYRMALVYHVQPRQTRSVLTEAFDFNFPYLKEADEVEIDAAINDSLTVKIWSDGTGGDVVVVENRTVPYSPGAGRRVYQVPFLQRRYGRIWRIQLQSNQPFQVWEARLHMRIVPVQVAGSQAWITPEVSPNGL